MTSLEHSGMEEPDDVGRPQLWRWVRIVSLSIAVLFVAAYAAGYTAGFVSRGGTMSIRAASTLGVCVLLILGGSWLIRREFRNRPKTAPLTAKERLNRNFMIGSVVTGGIMGGVIAAASGDLANSSVLSDAPLPPALAMAMVLTIGVLCPIMSIYWHRRVVDEQEAEAYKVGAMWGLYVFVFLGPVWWFAWRGGFVSEPDGPTLYFLVMATVGAIWLWKKYG